MLNIQRACEAALDMGQHMIRREKLGLPQGSRDVFELLLYSRGDNRDKLQERGGLATGLLSYCLARSRLKSSDICCADLVTRLH